MVYALQKYRHYLLGSPFKLFTDHSVLKYLVNNPVLGGEDLSLDSVVPGVLVLSGGEARQASPMWDQTICLD